MEMQEIFRQEERRDKKIKGKQREKKEGGR